MKSAAECQAPARYDTWFDSSIFDNIEVDAKYSVDALITEHGDSSSFIEPLSSEKQEWNAMMQK